MSITLINKASTLVDDLFKASNLTQDEKKEIQQKMDHFIMLDDAWKYKNLTHIRSTDTCDKKAHFERVRDTPQIYILFYVLTQLGYTLDIVPNTQIR